MKVNAFFPGVCEWKFQVLHILHLAGSCPEQLQKNERLNSKRGPRWGRGGDGVTGPPGRCRHLQSEAGAAFPPKLVVGNDESPWDTLRGLGAFGEGHRPRHGSQGQGHPGAGLGVTEPPTQLLPARWLPWLTLQPTSGFPRAQVCMSSV